MSDSAGDNEADHYIFRTLEGEPIKYDSQPAHIPGTLHEIKACCERTGAFMDLLEDGAVMLSNGKLAIDNTDNIAFISGAHAGAKVYSFDDPCPSTAVRIGEYNRAALAATPSRRPVAPSPDDAQLT